jgi:hypothetical protein
MRGITKPGSTIALGNQNTINRDLPKDEVDAGEQKVKKISAIGRKAHEEAMSKLDMEEAFKLKALEKERGRIEERGKQNDDDLKRRDEQNQKRGSEEAAKQEEEASKQIEQLKRQQRAQLLKDKREEELQKAKHITSEAQSKAGNELERKKSDEEVRKFTVKKEHERDVEDTKHKAKMEEEEKAAKKRAEEAEKKRAEEAEKKKKEEQEKYNSKEGRQKRAPLVNLARSASCSQSSCYYGYCCHLAIDGNRNGHWGGGSVFHTWWHQAWLNIDLPRVAWVVTRVSVFNRQDCCDWRLNPFYLQLRNSGGGVIAQQWFHYTTYQYNWNGEWRNVKSVFLQLGRNDYLNIAEVEVWGRNFVE